MIREMLDQYFDLRGKLYEAFGYHTEWRQVPLSDRRDMYWRVRKSCVIYSETIEELKNEHFYEEQIFDTRDERQPVWSKDGYTMILTDPECDGGTFLNVFDDQKKIAEEPDGHE